MHEKDIISAPDTSFIYEIPITFEKDYLSERLLEKFGIKKPRQTKNGLDKWRNTLKSAQRVTKPVRIGIVGKYFETGAYVLSDSYISVIEAIKYAAWANKRLPELVWLNAEEYEHNKNAVNKLKEYDGIIIPGGFGSRGVEGKIRVVEYCRINNIPFFGLCYGLQMAVIEFARHVCRMVNAHTTEVSSDTKYPVIDIMPDQQENIKEKNLGGSMRLGSYACILTQGTIAGDAYGSKRVDERHRHRYEVNNAYKERLERNGLVVSGINPERGLVEIIELPSHPFFVATQFHPELQSRFLEPHPLFLSFIVAAIKQNNNNKKTSKI
jgi:CTP synthase